MTIHQYYNIEAEQILLGHLIAYPYKIDHIQDSTKKEFFFEKKHQMIYQCILQLHNSDMNISELSIKQALLSQNANYSEYITQIVAMGFRAHSIKSYKQILTTMAMKRSLLNISNDILTNLETKHEESEIQECLSSIDKQLSQVNEFGTINTNNFSTLDNSIGELIEYLKADKNLISLHTGYKTLDKKLQGFKQGDLIILAARPGMGKTTFALNIAYNIAVQSSTSDKEGVIAMFSLEMSTIQITNKILALESQVDSSKILTNNISEEEYSRVRHSIERLKELPIAIDDTGALTINLLRAKARRLKRNKKVEFIIVDYLQLLQVENKYNNRVLEISQITQALKALAKELNIPILVLSQLSRAVESRVDKKPLLSDLRDSGSIEQDADMVMFIYRPEYYQHEEESIQTNENNTEVIIAKNRNGPTGIGQLQFFPKFSQFSEIKNS